MKNIVTFDKSLKKDILDIFDKSIDEEGYIVEKSNTKQRVLSAEGDELELEDFAGIKKGSEVFIKNNIISLIDYVNSDKK